jgi:hypothetical protein
VKAPLAEKVDLGPCRSFRVTVVFAARPVIVPPTE